MSAAETKRLGRCLGRLLQPGCLLFLIGPFGAGKTTFTQGIGRALGIADPITSPSFTLVNEYHAKAGTLFHVDLFRIERPEEALALGLDEYLNDRRFCVVEWPDQAGALLPLERLEIYFAYLGRGRRFELKGNGIKHAAIVRRFAAECIAPTLGAGR